MKKKYRLKKCKVEDLQAGMILGKSVYDDNEKVLVSEGTELNNVLIFKLMERCLDEVELFDLTAPLHSTGPKAIQDANVLDVAYVGQYQAVFERLRQIFAAARRACNVDIDEVEKIIEEAGFMNMVDGFKAITQVHNIPRGEDYLIHHSLRVAILLGVMGKWLGLKRESLKNLLLTGLLYEIGKTQIPEELLDKTEKLTAEELQQLRRHAAMGFELLRYGKLKEKTDVLFGILQHHERLDGSGYPGKMSGKQICEFAKLLAIADIYDAMAAKKSYAASTSPFTIFNLLADEIAAKKLDARYVVLFVENMRRALNGNWVRLSDDTIAKIIYVDEKDLRALPIVQTREGEFIDLNKEPSLSIINLLTVDQIT